MIVRDTSSGAGRDGGLKTSRMHQRVNRPSRLLDRISAGAC